MIEFVGYTGVSGTGTGTGTGTIFGGNWVSRNSLLLVDSDTKNRQVLEVSLKKAGFNVTTADNGRDALGKVETAQPDLIISDTEMTEMSGFEFCAQLKKSPEWQDIPF